MNKKSLGIFAILGASTMVASILNINQPELNWSIFAGGTDEWHHYDASMPGEVEGLENGIREYWVRCGGSYQFTKPNSLNIIDCEKDYELSGFTSDDDRYIYPVKLNTVSEVDMEASQKSLSLGSFGTFDEVYNAYVAGDAPAQSKKRSSLNTQFDLGNDLSNLDVSEFSSNHSDDGEHTVNIYGLKDGKAYFVEVPTIFVTSYITNTPESIRKMLTLVQTGVSDGKAIIASRNNVYGYFKLKENLSNDSLQNAGRLQNYDSQWYSSKFYGTLDGNGKTISSQTCYPGGLFCNANNATFKNFTINDIWCRNAAANYSLIASITDGCTFDNVSFNISGAARDAIIDPSTKPGTKYGWISSERFINNTLANCTFNTNTESVTSLFSSVEYTNNTFTDCAFTGNKYCAIGGQKVGDIYQFVTTEAGLNINTTLALLNVSKNIVIYENGVTKTTLDLDDTGFKNASVTSIRLKNYDLGNDLSDLNVSDAIYDESIRGNQEILVTVVDPKTNKPLTLSFNVNVGFDGVTKETISNGNQILDASLTSKQSLSLSGTDFANSTVKEIRIGGQLIGESLDDIVIPDSLRNDKTKHGETEVTIKLIKDGETKLIGFNVRLATRVMWNSVESVSAVLPYLASKTADPMTGYYILGETIDIANSATLKELLPATWYTGWENEGIFSGTFDGNGKTLKWKSSYSGLFHILNGATIKDLTVQDAWYKGCSTDSSLLAAKICNTRLENVSLVAIANLNQTTKTTSSDIGSGAYGWVSRVQFQNNTVVNCSFNTQTAEVTRLFCTQNGGNNTFTNCTFTTAGYYSLYKHYQLGELFAYSGLTINGNALTSLNSQPIIVNEENQSISLSGTPFETDTVNSIKLGNYSLGTNLSNLVISDSAMADVSIRGNTYAVVNVTHSGLSVNVKVPLTVSAKVDAKTLNIDPLIINLSSQTKSISLAGTDYQNDTVSDIALLDLNGSAEYSVGSNLSNLVISNEIVNDKSLHGEYKALITLEHNAIPTKVMVPVILATKAIATFKDFTDTFQPTSFNDAAESFVEGYYVQTADISTTSNVNGKVIGQGSSPTINHGLKGTYNGLNHNITIGGAATVYNGGLFTSIYDGGTLKNVKITGSPNSGSSGAALIGSVVADAILDNVELKYTALNSSAVLGVFGSFYFRNNTVSNVVVDATGLTIPSLFGRYYDGTSTFENVKVKANGINYVGDNNWNLYVLYNGSNLPTGVTFVSTAA